MKAAALGALAVVLFAAPAAASEVEMPRGERHPRERFPLAVHVAPIADATLDAAVKRAVEDWNALFRDVLGVTAFRWATRAHEAAVTVVLAPRVPGQRPSSKMMGETEIHADRNGMIELPVRITLAEPTARGQTPPETILYQVAAHELGHALGLPHTDDPRSLMCCVRGSVDFKDPAVRQLYIEARRHPDLRSVEAQLKAYWGQVSK